MKFTVDYFIKKFTAIPEELWFTGSFFSKDLRRACALGHCKENMEDVALHDLFPRMDGTSGSYVANINDGTHPRYQQPTPKQRIIAALCDIKKAQQPEVKERIVYVTIDESVKALTVLEDVKQN